MTTEQKEQYRDLLEHMAKARTADAATTDNLVLAVADLLEEVERLTAELTKVDPTKVYDTVYTVFDVDNDSATMYRGPDVSMARNAAKSVSCANIRVWRKKYGHSVDYEHWQNGKRWNPHGGTWEVVA